MNHTDGRVVSARGLLTPFTQAGLVDAPDVHVAAMLARTAGETDERVVLAAALAVRALRAGSVCLPLSQVHRLAASFAHREDPDPLHPQMDLQALPWPEPQQWSAALRASALVGDASAAPNSHPLRLVDEAIYLERYWCDQESVVTRLMARCGPADDVDEQVLSASLARLFGDDAHEAGQRMAVETAVRARTAVIAGGPGTGKTTTVARLVSAIADQFGGRPAPVRIGLAAPTGKAAARLSQALQDGQLSDQVGLAATRAVTLHRLLGARPGHSANHGPGNPLALDLVVVDEMSMVSLSLMARLLDALSDHTRLVMVGDPAQLTPVDAGAVLADITAVPLPGPDPQHAAIVELQHGFRFNANIAAFAHDVRSGDPDTVLSGMDANPSVEFVDCDPATVDLAGLPRLRADLVGQATALLGAAREGDVDGAIGALDSHRLLCAHRSGPYGVGRWSALAERVQRPARPAGEQQEWYLGRPLLATVNAAELGLSNGDTGIVVNTAQGIRAAMSNGRCYPPFLLTGVETMFALTVHKSQGSQFDRLTLILPSPDSPLLTRELIYTAITRARRQVRIIGPRESLAVAVRTPARRASGLTGQLLARLQPPGTA
ncbi:DNA helicase/exodeoxyribonuclease V, alpha subunit [Propionibacterium cyclohexanicum]|uniref:RecBCD enzyme subunit RecD n=1 Tax=Propionibacterium cyclohexanicum TaxID=64702 RepID=A0A1H9RBM4_9ACTN|nr:exodeoxyribonuclease V subunit alpha [Propionibacterium cyclohexanicum]SER70058.1 DNA helicase/exodeoxyribonuclease V, alpha subunit [Propionibacterium cyclohexanicum]